MTENRRAAAFCRKRTLPPRRLRGQALRHTAMRVVREDGTDCDVGESGELWCKGPIVTPGYWRREDANADTFVDGWLRTGDIGSRDAEGFYYVEDRLKDMYISGGENVYPAEVESLLYEIETIAVVAVIGVPDERWGEVGCAVVAVKEGQLLEAQTVLAYGRDRLARFKQPAHVVFVDALPRNATGKVLSISFGRR